MSRIALLLPLIVSGTGVAALVGRERPLAAAVGAGFAVWNPFVIERLTMGDWSLLWAYCAVPWIILFGARARSGSGPGPLLGWVALASITPTGGLLAALSAAVSVWPERKMARRRWAGVTAAALALQLPWIVAGIVGAAHGTSDVAAVSAFAARAEHPGGVVASLLGGGGAWNADVVPSSRTGWLALVALAVLVVGVVLGWRPARTALGTANVRRLVCCAAVGLALAASTSVPGVAGIVRWLVRAVPGTGILRDAQKWLMPYVSFLGVMLGYAAARVAKLGAARLAAGAFALLLPILLLPDGPSTVRPVLEPVVYPSDWSWAAHSVGHHGPVLVLPFQPYRAFAWAPGRPVLDPAPRLLPGEVIVSDRLTVSGLTLAGEDQRVARVTAILSSKASLARSLGGQGIGWVLIESGTPGQLPDLRGLHLVRRGAALTLYRVPGTIAPSATSGRQIAAVLIADALALTTLVAAGWLTVAQRSRLLQ